MGEKRKKGPERAGKKRRKLEGEKSQKRTK